MMKIDEFEKKFEQALTNAYSIKLYPITDENGTEWSAEIPELAGCIGAGDTPQEALLALEDAKMSWIEIALIDKRSIPEPKNLENVDYSGKFTIRLPKSLHRELTERAEEENISLNQYLLYLITKRHNEKQAKVVSVKLNTETQRIIETPLISSGQWSKQYQSHENYNYRRVKVVQ